MKRYWWSGDGDEQDQRLWDPVKIRDPAVVRVFMGDTTITCDIREVGQRCFECFWRVVSMVFTQ